MTRYLLLKDTDMTFHSTPDYIVGVVANEDLAKRWRAKDSAFRAYLSIPSEIIDEEIEKELNDENSQE